MTAPMETFKSHSSTTDLIGQNWQKLIDLIESRPDVGEADPFDGGGDQQPVEGADDNVLLALQDVKRLRQKDMPLFGHCPETDAFYTVVCSSCSMILMPHALKDHYDKRHGDGAKAFGGSDKQALDPQVKSKSKRVTPVKIEKSEKPRKTKSGSGSEMTDEVLKDQKKSEKSKKVKDHPPSTEIEYVFMHAYQSPRTERVKLKNIPGPRFEPQPNVPLSPVLVAENLSELNEEVDLPKKRQRERKKSERRTDKVFDPDRHCGVINESGKPCVRSILCKVHQVAYKRAVPNRSMTYDMLIRIMKMNGEDEKVKPENGFYRPKVERYEKERSYQPAERFTNSANHWGSDQMEEPPIKRLKIKKEDIVYEECDQSQLALPSHLEALIDETLRNFKEGEESESMISIIPIPPQPEPVLRWNADIFGPPPREPSPPPQIILNDVHWHSSNPRPLATNNFGCRVIGGLMSTCKKLDTLRRHLQSAWTSSSEPSSPMNPCYIDPYNHINGHNSCVVNLNIRNSIDYPNFIRMPNMMEKVVTPIVINNNATSPVMRDSYVRRGRTSASIIAPPQIASNTSDVISGLLINSVPMQRTVVPAVPNIPTGVIPVNSITGHGVPLRLFHGSLPVIASTAPSHSATYIQLNLCPK